MTEKGVLTNEGKSEKTGREFRKEKNVVIMTKMFSRGMGSWEK